MKSKKNDKASSAKNSKTTKDVDKNKSENSAEYNKLGKLYIYYM